jgi:hypothetical protein
VSGSERDLVPPDGPNDPGEIASAGRSCLVILILVAALIVLFCVGIAVRWATA